MPTPAEAIAAVNRSLREFTRFTGDGKPGEPSNAPLPIGDPQSGVYNPRKSDLRQAFVGAFEAIELAGDLSEAVSLAEGFADMSAAEKDMAIEARNEAENFALLASQGNKGEDGDGFLRGFAYSLNVADPAHDIDVAPGSARDLENLSTITLSITMAKRIDAAWQAGTNQGGLDTGVVANGTWYHIHVINNPTNGNVDVLFSTSQSAPVLPTGFTRRRWIGAFTYFANAIFPFVNTGELTQFKEPVPSVSGAPNSTVPTLRQLIGPPGVKSTIRALVISYDAASAVMGGAVIRDPDLGSYTTNANQRLNYYGVGQVASVMADLVTDNLGRVYSSDTNDGGVISIIAHSWSVDRQVYR